MACEPRTQCRILYIVCSLFLLYDPGTSVCPYTRTLGRVMTAVSTYVPATTKYTCPPQQRSPRQPQPEPASHQASGPNSNVRVRYSAPLKLERRIGKRPISCSKDAPS